MTKTKTKKKKMTAAPAKKPRAKKCANMLCPGGTATLERYGWGGKGPLRWCCDQCGWAADRRCDAGGDHG